MGGFRGHSFNNTTTMCKFNSSDYSQVLKSGRATRVGHTAVPTPGLIWQQQPQAHSSRLTLFNGHLVGVLLCQVTFYCILQTLLMIKAVQQFGAKRRLKQGSAEGFLICVDQPWPGLGSSKVWLRHNSWYMWWAVSIEFNPCYQVAYEFSSQS